MTKKKRELPPLRPSSECAHDGRWKVLTWDDAVRCSKCCPCSVCARWRWEKENAL